MGISLELYRARIGTINRCKVKDVASEPDLDLAPSAQPPPLDPMIKLSWKQCSLGLLLIIISAICHGHLLLISGVESHPGPLDNEQVSNILAELCVDAPNDSVRDALRTYDVELHTSQNKKKFQKVKKQDIVETLEYLGLKNQISYTKPTCVHSLICRIENLLPDTCSMCEEDYTVGRLETPLLSCEDCGQGSHNKCILDKLEIEEADRENFTPAEAISKINPIGLPGIHYLCSKCSDEHIPSKEAGLCKNQNLRSTSVSDTGGNQSQPQDDEDEEDEDDEDDEEAAEEAEDQDTSQDEPAATVTEEDTNDASNDDNSRKKKTCRYYRKGICRHGVSGRGCSFAHPKPCSKLLRHGNKAPHGCTLTRSQCDKFHPKMCPSSLSKGECITTNCTLRHVTGTKMPFNDTEHRKTSKPGKLPPRSKKSERVRNDNPSKHLTSSDFLESLRLLKLEMMEAMDVKLATLISTQTATQNTQPVPQPRPVEHPTWPHPHPWEIYQNNQYMMNQAHRGYPQTRGPQTGYQQAPLAAHQGC